MHRDDVIDQIHRCEQATRLALLAERLCLAVAPRQGCPPRIVPTRLCRSPVVACALVRLAVACARERATPWLIARRGGRDRHQIKARKEVARVPAASLMPRCSSPTEGQAGRSTFLPKTPVFRRQPDLATLRNHSVDCGVCRVISHFYTVLTLTVLPVRYSSPIPTPPEAAAASSA